MTITQEQLIDSVTKLVTKTNNFREGVNKAKELGLVTIGEKSSYALAIGYHAEMPNVVVKVVNIDEDGPFRDRSYHFLKAIYDGDLSGVHLPEVYSVTEIGKTAVILMEKLEALDDDLDVHDSDFDSDFYNLPEDVNYDVCTIRNALDGEEIEGYEDVAQLVDWIIYNSFTIDCHMGNMLKRDDGTIVLIDVVN